MTAAGLSSKGQPGLAPEAAAEAVTRMVPLIRQRMGLVIQQHQLRDLAAAVAEAAHHFGYASARHLAECFASLNDAAPELNYLVSRITVGESFFFRDAAQMAFLRDEFLPALVQQRQADDTRTLRIWSAAASQGQELYSVAMLLHELLKTRPVGWNAHLLGTDINTEGLATALQGQYREWSLRGVDEQLRMRHFEHDSGTPRDAAAWQVGAAVRSMCRFAYLNLASETYPSVLTDTQAMDLILCRNVFIYFDPVLVRRILARLVQCLAPGGVLLLGPSDIVEARVEGLESHSRQGMFFYRKLQPPRPRKAAVEAPAQPDAGALLEQMRGLAAGKRWRELIALESRHAQALAGAAAAQLLLATAYGNIGHHAEALQRCARALALAPTDKQCHFLHALLLQEAGDAALAKAALKRALFLDPSFLEAHYQLGVLLIAQGQRSQGAKSLSNALALAQRCAPGSRLNGDPGLSVVNLIDILRNELLLRQDPSP